MRTKVLVQITLMFITVNLTGQSWLKSRCIRNDSIKFNKITAYTAEFTDCNNLLDSSSIDSFNYVREVETFNVNGQLIMSYNYLGLDNSKIKTIYHYRDGKLSKEVKKSRNQVIEEIEYEKVNDGLEKVTISNKSTDVRYSYFIQKNQKGQQVSNYRLNTNGDTLTIRYINYDENDLPISMVAYDNGEREYLKIYIRDENGELKRNLKIGSDGKIIKSEPERVKYVNLREFGLNANDMKPEDNIMILDKYGNIEKYIIKDSNGINCTVWYYEIEYINKR